MKRHVDPPARVIDKSYIACDNNVKDKNRLRTRISPSHFEGPLVPLALIFAILMIASQVHPSESSLRIPANFVLALRRSLRNLALETLKTLYPNAI